MAKLSAAEALIYVMLTTASADKKFVDPELKRIGAICDVLPVFSAIERSDLERISANCMVILAQKTGVQDIIDLVVGTLPQRLHPTAYALALDIAAADLEVPPEEIYFLQLLCDAFKIDKLTAVALETSAQVRARKDTTTD